MSITSRLADNLLNNSFNDFDTHTVHYAKTRIIDTVGAILGGIHSSGADMMCKIVGDWEGKQESSILGTNKKVPAANAVLVMGIMARSNDFEPAGGPDICGRRYTGHYSATSVPTAITVTQKMGLGGKDLITALILGDDLSTRIGAAGADPGFIERGWDPAGTCNRFGAAAIAGKLMKLNKDQLLNALGIVLTQIAGTMLPVFEYTHSFKISQGIAGWNGILSAELAREGFTGPTEPLTGQYGFFQQYCGETCHETLTHKLGKVFYADEEFKLFPCCRGNAGAVETALKLVRDNDIRPDHIAEIQVDLDSAMNGTFLIQKFKPGPCLQATAILNLSYNIASAILRKDAKPEHYSDEAILDPQITMLTDKIKLNITVPGKEKFCRITIRMDDDREYSLISDVPKGDYHASPLTQEEIESKFFYNMEYSGVINHKQAKQAFSLLNRLESLETLDELIKTLSPS